MKLAALNIPLPKSYSSLDRLVDLGENHTEGLQSNFHQEKTGSGSSRIEW